jgi:tellurite resistance protein TerC
VVVVWIVFLTLILVLLALDLGVFHRRAHVVSVREALTWSVIWIVTSLAFAGFVYLGYEHHWLGLGLQPDLVDRSPEFPDGRINDGRSAVLKYLTGYVVEKSLSVDNVFVIAMLFGYFAVPRIYQHRVLFWGILGALAMRGAMIAIGAQLVAEFSWILYVFGVVLIATAVKMMFIETGHSDPGQNAIVRLMRRSFPITDRYHGEHFFVRAGTAASLEPSTPGAGDTASDAAVHRTRRGTLMLTPLALALVMVETTDLVFAVDSIPAIFAITADPFLVFTSNVFAILGLRSLYFALAGALHSFRYLKHALSLVLLTVGVKMLAHTPLERALGPNFNLYLLAAVLLILAGGVVASLIASHPAGRRLRELIVPDRLIDTILRAALAHRARRVVPRAKDMMTAVPASCAPEATLDHVARLMADNDCGEIPVVDLDDRLIGVVTEHDIVCRVVAQGSNPAECTADGYISQPVVSVPIDASFGQVIVTMETHNLRSIPVVDEGGRCAGMIALADVA